MSIWPSLSLTTRGIVSICSTFVTSIGCVSIFAWVVCMMSRAASASADSRRAQIRTFTPSRASARAVSRPIPLLPPVTRAVLFASPSSIVLTPFNDPTTCDHQAFYKFPGSSRRHPPHCSLHGACDLFRRHQGREVGVGARHHREDRCVDHAQTLHPLHAALRDDVHHRIVLPAHAT